MPDRFYVELAPGYVRLRHELGIGTRLMPGRLSARDWEFLRELEAREEAGERVVIPRSEDADEYGAYLVWREREDARREAEEFAARLPADEGAAFLEEWGLAEGKAAAEARVGRGARGMSTRSRQEMWRWVLSLPFEMLGSRPLWITLTYPGDWRPWVPDGRTLERHRRAFGEAWFRGFGERPLGFWSKEFQLAEGRPHLHLLLKGPKGMADADYRGFQELTRLGNANTRTHGKHQGRWWTPPIGERYGGQTAVDLLRWWSQITTGGAVENHARRGVNVRAVFFARGDVAALTKRRAAIAAYMAGEAAKFGQKVPPDDFGTVGRYFGAFGERAGFRPVVDAFEVEREVWFELNRRLTLLDALRRRAKGRPLGEDAKKRRPWQGLTVGGVGVEEYGRLYAWSYAAAQRKAGTVPSEGEAG